MPTYEFHAKNVRDGSTDVQAGQALTQEWECVTDTATVDAGDVIAALAALVGIAKGAPHPTYAYARCTNVAAKVYEQDPFRWDVRATFKEPRPLPGAEVNPEGGQPAPPARAPWVSGHFADEQTYPGIDLDGAPIVNTAGDAFDNPPPVPATIGNFTVTKFFASIDYTVLSGYKNAINDDTWQGFPAHSLRITGVAWAPHSENGWAGWKVTFDVSHKDTYPEQLEADPTATGGWHPLPVLDVGWNQMVFNPIADYKAPYDEPEGSSVPKNTPGFLDGANGYRSDVPVYIPFRVYPELSFAILDPP